MFVAAGLMLATPSCKKGENDPFLSLSSRKARVAGDWEMTDYAYTSTNTENDGDYQTVTETFANGVITRIDLDYDAASATSNSVTTTTTIDKSTMTFGKDGTWNREYNTTSVSSTTILTYTTTVTTTRTMTSSGTWAFVGKTKDVYKNKERIVLTTLTETNTDQTTDVTVDSDGIVPTVTNTGDTYGDTEVYANGQNQMTWDIDQLKGKEMKVKMAADYSGSWSNTTSGGTNTTGPYDVYTSTTDMTLSIVK